MADKVTPQDRARAWLNSKHFTADSGETLDCVAVLPDDHAIAINIGQLAQLLAAFAAAESERADRAEKERDKYQEWMNCGGYPTNDLCGSPDEPGHEIFGPYHSVADGTFRCQIHFEREQIKRAETAEADVTRLTRERD